MNHGDNDYNVKVGDRIAQIIIEKIDTSTPQLVKSLANTTRGDKGFGSTGVRGDTHDTGYDSDKSNTTAASMPATAEVSWVSVFHKKDRKALSTPLQHKDMPKDAAAYTGRRKTGASTRPLGTRSLSTTTGGTVTAHTSCSTSRGRVSHGLRLPPPLPNHLRRKRRPKRQCLSRQLHQLRRERRRNRHHCLAPPLHARPPTWH